MPHLLAAGSAATIAILVLSAGAASAASRPEIVQHSIDASSAGPIVVAIGDSIMEGHGLESDQAWLALLAEQDGWRFTNLASDGSGFVTAGNNGDRFADQAVVAEGLHPDVIILAGSSNDLGADDKTIDDATAATIVGLHAAVPTATIITVSSTWGDTAVPAQMNAIDAAVDTATTAVGGVFLEIGQPLAGQPTLMQDDDVHPTAAGQGILAAAVGRELAKARIIL